jgi:hypothetical protein
MARNTMRCTSCRLVKVRSGKNQKQHTSHVVPVRREMESGRSPLANIPPFGRGFSRAPSTRPTGETLTRFLGPD